MTIAQSLLSLQSTDQTLALRRRDYRGVEQELKSEDGLPELRENCEKTKVRELESKVETARLESEFAMLKEKVSELETRLYGGAITNVRELTAIETEHSAARRSLAQVEESIAPAEVAAEHARQQFEGLTNELAEKEKLWQNRNVELKQDLYRLGSEYNEMLEVRDWNMNCRRSSSSSLGRETGAICEALKCSRHSSLNSARRSSST